ncbi:MAG TPA: cytochrome c-type biogenesis protein [Caulobacteraceae bacterium]|jgi:cytochrome c-type biogenesis protein CcmH|nr:cytochrome c-type biogenesis protein [Caulobacteraceae bacterium]
MSWRRWAAVAGAVLCLAAAADPGERLADPAREARARSLFRETRCLVCQGESIDESDAALAADLRRAIRERVGAGQSDDEVRAFLVARYGDFVLFRPRLTLTNALLWSAPFVVALAGLGLLIARHRGASEPAAPLSPAEEARLAALDGSSDTKAPELGSKNASELTER